MAADSNLVSVIIPAFDSAETLPQTVESVRRQRDARTEIIIVDDGSTDDTRAVVERLGPDLHYLYKQNAGVSVARNAGIAAATGSLIALLDADDTWPEDALAVQLPRLAADPSVAVVLGLSQIMLLDGRDEHGRPHFTPAHAPWHGPHLASALFRRTVFEQVGLFDPKLRLGQDIDWFIRAREHGVRGVRINAITLYYHVHEANRTRHADPRARNLLRVLKRSLDRRRQSRGAGSLADPVADWPLLEDAPQ